MSLVIFVSQSLATRRILCLDITARCSRQAWQRRLRSESTRRNAALLFSLAHATAADSLGVKLPAEWSLSWAVAANHAFLYGADIAGIMADLGTLGGSSGAPSTTRK